ncbi:MAG: response regulator transcription factor [Desulfatibacillaceae bacterium]
MALKDAGKKRILVVEDEEHIAEGIRLNLSLRGYEAEWAADGVQGLTRFLEWRPDLVVLDLMLPGMDGYSVLKAIRLEDERVPVLILSARSDTRDKIRGFSYGVDDYLAKPFNLEELLMRVERLLQRAGWSRSGSVEDTTEEIEEFGDNTVDLQNHVAWCRFGELVLSEQEVRLLRAFFANPGKALSRAELLELAWGYTGETNTRTVDNFIVRLRKYFEANPKRPVHFKSLRSVGYVFDPDGTEA